MKNSPSCFAELVERLGPQIDAALDAQTALGEGCPSRLREAMRYSLLAPGKRLRPMLALLAAEACGGSLEAALPAACAVEMVHAYSLIHDDLPAMDDDDLRRGRSTCHKAFDEATAILAGDALLTLAFEVLAEQVQPPVVAAACCAALARAAGACNMVGGQADDVRAEGRGKGRGERGESGVEREEGAAVPAAAKRNVNPQSTIINQKKTNSNKHYHSPLPPTHTSPLHSLPSPLFSNPSTTGKPAR